MNKKIDSRRRRLLAAPEVLSSQGIRIQRHEHVGRLSQA